MRQTRISSPAQGGGLVIFTPKMYLIACCFPLSCMPSHLNHTPHRYFQGRYGDLDSSVISYGPCQTPTLGFVVDRFDEIKSFQSETFWILDTVLDCGGGGGMLSVQWQKGRLFEERAAEIFSSLVLEDKHLLCTSVKKSPARKQRPGALNTVALLKMASKGLGIGPQAAMRAAENLYLSGCLSYPRTESTAYPQSFDFKETLGVLRSHPDLGLYAKDLLRDGWTNPRTGQDAGDHPPITPVAPIYNSPVFDNDCHRIYDLVVRHFLASISPGTYIHELSCHTVILLYCLYCTLLKL